MGLVTAIVSGTSNTLKETIKNTPVIKKERIRVGDKVDVLFNTPQEAINSIKEGK